MKSVRGLRNTIEWIGICCWPIVITAVVWFLANLEYTALGNHKMIMENQRIMNHMLQEIATRIPCK